MGIFAKIPLNKSNYSLYVNSYVTKKIYVEGLGTLLCAESVAVAFYSFSNYRRAYVFCECDKASDDIGLLKGKLPLIKDNVKVIYFAEGRKIDLLKFAIYNLEKLYGMDIYHYNVSYWLRLTSMIDGMSAHTKTLRPVKLFTERYLKEQERLNKAKLL